LDSTITPPGKQTAPFEFVLVFFMRGLALTRIVGDEVSFTNAICQIISIALAYSCIAGGVRKSQKFARLADGTPLILIETLHHMRVTDDVSSAASAALPHGERNIRP
jgi:hypothetical protein